MPDRPQRSRSDARADAGARAAARLSACAASIVLGVALLAAACGGAIDDSELFQKDQGSSGSSGGSPAATPTATATSSPPSPPPGKPPPTKTDCQVSFKKDVLDVLSRNGCGNLGCHGGADARSMPVIEPSSAALTYKNLVSYRLEGKSYVTVGSKDPDDSAITCNLQGDCGVRMPLGDKVSGKDLSVIEEWLACGAAFN